MLSEVLTVFKNIPNVWSEGAIFAFSGIDGDTYVLSEFVGTYAREPYGLLFHTPRRRILDIDVGSQGTTRIATGDVYAIETPNGELVVSFSAWHTLIGAMPHNTRLWLRFEDGTDARWAAPFWISEDLQQQDVLALIERDGHFAVAYGRSVEQACQRAEAGLALDIWDEVSQRLAIYHQVPALDSAEYDRLFKKCISVMKVNTLSKEGSIGQTWSTPDRVPHEAMWLWDSVFHSLAMNYLSPEIGWDFLKSVLDTQQADGMIPHQASVTGKTSAITQPPLLAWAVWENYKVLKDTSCLEYALPRLERYLEWDCANRDRNANELLEWYIEENERSRSGESGMDNSPRFDRALLLDAVDFSTFAALDMHYTSCIADQLGKPRKAGAWQQRSNQIASNIHGYLWNEQEGFYYDRDMDGNYSSAKAVSGFMPLLLDSIPPGHVDRLIQALLDPELFNTAFPAPSVAVSDPAWSTDMWRGPTWINTNYFIILGLLKHGKSQEARWLARKTIDVVLKYYEQYGVIFEFYDAQDRVPPIACDRKGPRREPYNIRNKMDSIRDYHWSAALTACLLLEGWHDR